MSVSTPTQPTPAALALDALAQLLAQRNPDAAQELGRRLAHHAQQRKRVLGLGIAIRVNMVTMQLEMQAE